MSNKYESGDSWNWWENDPDDPRHCPKEPLPEDLGHECDHWVTAKANKPGSVMYLPEHPDDVRDDAFVVIHNPEHGIYDLGEWE